MDDYEGPLHEEEEAEEVLGGHGDNLAMELGEDQLHFIGNMVVDNYEVDKRSRSEWEQQFSKGLKLLGLKIEQLSEPFKGACSASAALSSSCRFCTGDIRPGRPP